MIARPRPIPLVLLLVVKGWNSLLRTSAGMPGFSGGVLAMADRQMSLAERRELFRRHLDGLARAGERRRVYGGDGERRGMAKRRQRGEGNGGENFMDRFHSAWKISSRSGGGLPKFMPLKNRRSAIELSPGFL